MVSELRLERHRYRSRLWPARRSAHFADLESHKAPDRNIFTELDDRLGDHFADGHALVLDVVLFVKAVFLVELFHFPVDDFFAAAACPFFRRTAMAFSMSPPASTSAARQSAKPALVRSRNSLTSWAGICTAGCCVLILFSLCCLEISLLVLLAAKRARTESLGAGLTN